MKVIATWRGQELSDAPELVRLGSGSTETLADSASVDLAARHGLSPEQAARNAARHPWLEELLRVVARHHAPFNRSRDGAFGATEIPYMRTAG